ncbi:hypothetical protein AURDEDRAFT_164302 [Auricularia subglabra TFB-10046 SS5]|nr:hypothetical protein AURDEDRAFT_164302 [Auricularia subglabra TFB-10046 SS5]
MNAAKAKTKTRTDSRAAKGSGVRSVASQGASPPTPAAQRSRPGNVSMGTPASFPPLGPSNSSAQKPRTPVKQHSHYLECNQLAQSFVGIRSDSVREADAALVSAISAPSNALQALPAAQRTWDAVRAELSQGSTRPRPRATVAPPPREPDELVMKHVKWFVTFGQYKDAAKRVSDWFSKAVADPDLVAARAEVDLNSIDSVVSHAGRLTATSLFFKKERKEKQLIDVGIIRYPDPKQPYVRAYRIELTAWYESMTVFGCTIDKNGVKAKINMGDFEPSGTAVPSRRATDNAFAVAQAEALFA